MIEPEMLIANAYFHKLHINEYNYQGSILSSFQSPRYNYDSYIYGMCHIAFNKRTDKTQRSWTEKK